MAKDDKRKVLPKFTTPVGTFQYPKLAEPDYGTKDYPKPNGQYSVNLMLNAADAETKAFIKALTPAYEEAMAEAKAAFSELKAETRKKLKAVTENPLFTEQLDKETEEPTGIIVFKAAMTASGDYKKGPKAGEKWTRKPPIFDAKGNRIVKVPAIWGGTRGRVAVEASPYFIPGTGAAGLKLHLVGVKIVELVSAGERSADSLGLGGEEDGYAYSEPAAPDTPTDDSAEASDGSGDF